MHDSKIGKKANMFKMMKLWVLNGPNINLLGMREPHIYGSHTLSALEQKLVQTGQAQDCRVECFQTNSESALIDKIQQAPQSHVSGIIINPAAFTHTSVALRDALLAIGCPFIEVHISNIYARESFRHHSYFSDIALGVISGLGTDGYLYALTALIYHINTKEKV